MSEQLRYIVVSSAEIGGWPGGWGVYDLRGHIVVALRENGPHWGNREQAATKAAWLNAVEMERRK